MRWDGRRMVVDPVRRGIVKTGLCIGALASAWVGGCASPPAVGPLLRVVERAIADESDRLDVDRQRGQAWVDQQREALTDGFEADLSAQASLSADWVRDHALVYALAREAMARHEIELRREYEQRQANLNDARRAQQAAVMLVEQQDGLLSVLPDPRRWLSDAVGPAGAAVKEDAP